MTIRPLPGFVLILPIEDETTSAGGVYLPDTSKDKPSKGKVVSYGRAVKKKDKVMFEELDFGSIVVYKKWTNQEVQDQGKTYLLVPFSDLLAVIK